MTDDETPAYARGTDPETSHGAAAAISKSDLENKVYAIIKNAPGGLTCSEIADAGDIKINSVSPRLIRLEETGLIVRFGKRKCYDHKPQLVCYEATPENRARKAAFEEIENDRSRKTSKRPFTVPSGRPVEQ